MPAPAPVVDVLFEDNHLLVLNKPAMIATMGVSSDVPSMLTAAKDYLKRTYAKPGDAYVGIVSRLDGPVTGVLVMAKTSKAAARLSEAFRTRAVRKAYWAVVEHPPDAASATLEHFLRKDERHRKVHATQAGAAGAQLARLRYETLAVAGGWARLAVEPETGRKHQIRVQLARVGSPIVGDRKYGATAPLARGIALHARAIELEHPVRRTPLVVEAPVPAAWTADARIRRLL